MTQHASPLCLRRMPLHAISEVHGESGLQQRLRLEITEFPPAEQARLNRALELATDLHKQDRRVREPYIRHVPRIAIRIPSRSHYRVRDADVIAAALLHDSVEDHAHKRAGEASGDVRQAALARLADDFGARVAGLVRSVTNPPMSGPQKEHDERYR